MLLTYLTPEADSLPGVRVASHVVCLPGMQLAQDSDALMCGQAGRRERLLPRNHQPDAPAGKGCGELPCELCGLQGSQVGGRHPLPATPAARS